MNGHQMQMMVPPWTPMVKRLVIINVAVWVSLVLILQNFFMTEPKIFEWFGFVPYQFFTEFWVWQIFTYMFIHSSNVFHILFNMLVLWWFGHELEAKWGGRFFLTYYLVCGVGAGVIYLIGTFGYYLFTGQSLPLTFPMVGASGATFGLLWAFGLLFGERVVYFMMIFPMKAKVFVLILGGIELINLLSSGMSNQVANLAHLGGFVTGALYLWGRNRFDNFKLKPRSGRRLKLVVSNDKFVIEKDDKGGPKYWN